MWRWTYLIACLCIGLGAFAQAADPDGRVRMVPVVIDDGDTIPIYQLAPCEVEAKMGRSQRKRMERMDRLAQNVVKVYPYARITAELLADYERDLNLLEKEKEREAYLKIAEAELRAEFEEEIKGLTLSQGRVLVKLIDRETGRTGYEVVKQLRGGFQAWMWQGVARMFGNDLKDDYDGEGEDMVIESVVRRIENGEILTAQRSARTAKAQARLEKRKARLQRRYGLPMPPAVAN